MSGEASLTSSAIIGKVKAKIDWTKYSKRYKPEWEHLPECEGWLVRALGDDPSKSRCKLCRKELRAHLGDIKKHAKSDIHKHMMKITMGGKVKVEGHRVGPKYTRMANNYNEEWEDEQDCEGWLCRSDCGARCNVCNVELMPKLNELKKHGRSQKHLRAMTALWDKQGLGKDIRDDLKPAFQPWQLPDVRKKDFELKVSLLAAVEHGFNGVRQLCTVLQEQYGQGQSSFGMSGQQCEALFRLVLSPYFKECLRGDMRDAPFSLVFDTAANLVMPGGQVSAAIYYYSRSRRRAVSGYLGLVRVDRQDLSVMVESAVQLMAEWELYGFNMVSIVTDGIADVCGEQERDELVSLLLPTCPNLIHLRSSTSSALFSAFVAAVRKKSNGGESAIPPSLEFMLRETFNWFACKAERQLVYRDLLDLLQFRPASPEDPDGGDDLCEPMGLLTPIPSGGTAQWSGIADCTAGIFMHYDELKAHFAEEAEEGDYMAVLLQREYNDEQNWIYFAALHPILGNLSQLRQDVQNCGSGGSVTAGLCAKVESFFRSVAKQVMKSDSVANMKTADLCRFDLQSDEGQMLLLDADAVAFGQNFDAVLQGSSLAGEVKAKHKSNAATFLRELFVGLQSVIQEILSIMKNAEHFQMPNFMVNVLEKKHLVAPFFDQSDEATEEVMSKYRLMKMLDWKCKKETLLFWQEIHDFGDATGNFPLRVLSNSVWKMLCVPLFNDDVAKTLSEVNSLRRKAKAGLDPELLEEILLCKIGLKSLGKEAAQFQPPPELIKD